MLRKQAVFRASIHENLRLAELMYGGCIDYHGLHDKLICFASYVYDPYSIQIDSKPSVNTNSLIWRMLCLNPYSEQIRCVMNANTRIS